MGMSVMAVKVQSFGDRYLPYKTYIFGELGAKKNYHLIIIGAADSLLALQEIDNLIFSEPPVADFARELFRF